jgi:hypothetical protein
MYPKNGRYRVVRRLGATRIVIALEIYYNSGGSHLTSRLCRLAAVALAGCNETDDCLATATLGAADANLDVDRLPKLSCRQFIRKRNIPAFALDLSTETVNIGLTEVFQASWNLIGTRTIIAQLERAYYAILRRARFARS